MQILQQKSKDTVKVKVFRYAKFHEIGYFDPMRGLLVIDIDDNTKKILNTDPRRFAAIKSLSKNRCNVNFVNNG